MPNGVYNTGLISSLPNSSTAVVFSASAALGLPSAPDKNIAVGDLLWFQDGGNTYIFPITVHTDATKVTIAESYTGTALTDHPYYLLRGSAWQNVAILSQVLNDFINNFGDSMQFDTTNRIIELDRLAAGADALVKFLSSGVQQAMIGFDGNTTLTLKTGPVGSLVDVFDINITTGAVTWANAFTGFTSTGIDDNATKKVVEVNDGNLQLGDGASGETFHLGMVAPVGDGFFSLGSDPAFSSGISMLFYSSTHASSANDIRIYDANSLTTLYDSSASLWDFYANAIVTTGDLTVAGLTSTGIVDDAASLSVTINSSGYFKASDDGTYVSSSGAYHELKQTDSANAVVIASATHAAYTGTMLDIRGTRAATSSYNFGIWRSGGAADSEFKFSGDGNGTCDGSWTGGGADYAEYFEWSDGNPNGEDRRGVSVVLDGDQIRHAVDGETPFGVISGNPSVVGDAAALKWKGKHLKDDFGTYVWEDYDALEWTTTVEFEQEPAVKEVKSVAEVLDKDGNIVTPAIEAVKAAPAVMGSKDKNHSYAEDDVPADLTVPANATRTTQQRRKLNPDWSSDHEYIPREDRDEWDTVGLMGKLRLLKGQPVDSRWIKMRDVSATVEEWLVR